MSADVAWNRGSGECNCGCGFEEEDPCFEFDFLEGEEGGAGLFVGEMIVRRYSEITCRVEKIRKKIRLSVNFTPISKANDEDHLLGWHPQLLYTAPNTQESQCISLLPARRVLTHIVPSKVLLALRWAPETISE